MTAPLFHIVDADVWAAAVEAGQYAPESLRAEGFVHLSFADQVDGTLARYYAGVPNLVVVEFDGERLGLPVVVENLAGTGDFPHVYGPLPTAAAVAVRPVSRAGASGAASPDR